MWLDLQLANDSYKKYCVIHEFGHALGLDHEHQRSDFWDVIRPYVDVQRMKQDVSESTFNRVWDENSCSVTGSKTEYDPESVMSLQ